MKNHFKDMFISYGRRESLGFVGRLHQHLLFVPLLSIHPNQIETGSFS